MVYTQRHARLVDFCCMQVMCMCRRACLLFGFCSPNPSTPPPLLCQMMAMCGGHTDSFQRYGLLNPTAVEGLWAFGTGRQKMLAIYGDMACETDRALAEVRKGMHSGVNIRCCDESSDGCMCYTTALGLG